MNELCNAGLWDTTLWVWYLPMDLDALIARCKRVPGETGILIKAGDGAHPWGQWTKEAVDYIRQAGIGVGLWTFCYGRGVAHYDDGTERPGVDAELETLGKALARARPDAVVLNIENQIMTSPDPAADVEALVRGAQEMCGAVGVSSVWHWAESMAWPFDAAIRGGVDYWSNQVYEMEWDSYRHYDRLYRAYGGGKADYISVPPGGALNELGRWAREKTGRGLAYWQEGALTAYDWEGIIAVANEMRQPERAWSVGPGVLACMAAHGDTPAGDETYYSGNRDETISVTPGGRGVYVWVEAVDKIALIPWV